MSLILEAWPVKLKPTWAGFKNGHRLATMEVGPVNDWVLHGGKNIEGEESRAKTELNSSDGLNHSRPPDPIRSDINPKSLYPSLSAGGCSNRGEEGNRSTENSIGI